MGISSIRSDIFGYLKGQYKNKNIEKYQIFFFLFVWIYYQNLKNFNNLDLGLRFKDF